MFRIVVSGHSDAFVDSGRACMGTDYYKILGLDKGASDAEIKRAFRQKAHELHPDKGGDPAKFKEVNEAYQVLSDAEKKQQYDQYGQTFEQAKSQGGFGGFDGFRDFTGFTEGMGVNLDDLGEMFGGMFGGGGGSRRRQRKGADIQADLKVDFRDAVFGIERDIELWKTVTCDTCSGSGGDPSAKKSTCSTCGGRGQVQRVQRTILGSMQTVATCDACGGKGTTYEKQCKECRGGGLVKQKAMVRVNVPAGIDDGQTLRLTGEGEAVQGGPAGDLYLTVRVQPDPRFEREGSNIHSHVTISFPDAALGTEVDVDGLDGAVTLKIPAGTQSGQMFRLKGKGIPELKRSGRGDHLVHVQVETPRKLSKRQRQLLEEMKKEG